MAVGDSFLQMLEGLNSYYDNVETHPQDPFLHWEQITEKYEVLPSELENTVDLLPQGEVIRNADGSIRSYNIATEVSSDLDLASELNSNVQPTKTTVSVPANTTIDSTTGKVVATTGIAGGAAAGAFSAGDAKKLYTGLVAVGIASTLGKLILPELYEEHPNFFGDLEIGGVDGETWNRVTQKEENEAANRWFHSLMGSNGDGTATMYIDQDAFVYITKYLAQQGIFTGSGTIDLNSIINITEGYDLSRLIITPCHGYDSISFTRPSGVEVTLTAINGGKFFWFESGVSQHEGEYRCYYTAPSLYSDEYYTDVLAWEWSEYDPSTGETATSIQGRPSYVVSTYDGKNSYTNYIAPFSYINEPHSGVRVRTTVPIETILNSAYGVQAVGDLGWNILHNGTSEDTPVAGIQDQEGATRPILTGDETYQEILEQLQEIFPDWQDKSKTQTVVQPDGSVKTYVYVPVVLPVAVPGTQTETDPELEPEIRYVTGTQTQTKTIIDVETVPEEVVKTVVKVVKEVEKVNVVEETGEGTTPPVVPPTGSASALYTVYNPTNGEINSFGSWLWSSNFVDQLLKMFNDPMQAIISLHKVFCSPSVSGRDTIKVGYLDSGVSANVVSGQYVTIDCGTVNLAEQYQSVFDYPPFTDVTIYLPFVGFVRLDTNDVMRGSINVVYNIDVLTGACLAEVKVTRDMFGGVIYQYSGDCSVHYPLSSGSYMGIVSALLGVAGTVVSGGALAPMAIGMAAGAMRGHANVERSGSLSGNAGAMGIKKPYLVVQRPQVNTAVDFEKFEGKPSNYTVTIGECTGYIKCKEVHVINTPATESETQELVTLLKQGVIL